VGCSIDPLRSHQRSIELTTIDQTQANPSIISTGYKDTPQYRSIKPQTLEVVGFRGSIQPTGRDPADEDYNFQFELASGKLLPRKVLNSPTDSFSEQLIISSIQLKYKLEACENLLSNSKVRLFSKLVSLHLIISSLSVWTIEKYAFNSFPEYTKGEL
jgi:hypothetical protein